MLGPIDERTPPMTPQLALRVAMVGGIALLLFAVIFFRLWFLQVLSGSRYVAEAHSNHVAHIPVAAPRGEIVDAAGTPLVQSVKVPSIQIAPRSLPVPVTLYNLRHQPAKDYPLYDKLASLLRMSTKPRACKFTIYWKHGKYTNYDVQLAPIPCDVAKSVSQSSFANATIKTNVPTYIQDYIEERITEFPGVLSQDTYVSKYTLGNAGAQMFGTYGPITEAEVGTKAYNGIAAGNLVGQSGLEREYNWALQGVNGSEGIKVNSRGQFEGAAKTKPSIPGDTVKLSINAQLERVAQRELVHSININHGTGGSFVAMDPQTGAIYAMGSSPSYKPAKVSPSISTKELKLLDDPDSNQPLFDRAIDGALPDGSTFKVITAVAALESGKWSVDESFTDPPPPGYCFTGGLCLQNSGKSNYGTVDLQTAIEVSDDEFFYNLGDKMEGPSIDPSAYHPSPTEWPLQYWAGRFGIGHTTGVDLPGETAGEIGSPKLQKALWKLERECDTATGAYAYTSDSDPNLVSAAKQPGYHRSKPVHTVLGEGGESIVSGGCGIATAEYWSVGDNVNTGVGQYDDQVTPIQLAVVYSAIENGGTIVTPHIASEVESPSGTVVQKYKPAPKRKLDIDPSYLAAIQDGLRLAASAPGGTSADVMGSFPLRVYGKTGTAELGDSAYSPEHAWYVGYVPASATNKPIVVVVNVDKGGFGDVAAAPVVRTILSQWFYGKPGHYIEGSSAGDQT